MRLILGIGNPGEVYRNNRHNVGFMFLDFLADKYSISFNPSRNDFYYAEKKVGDNNLSLIKPSNYVNNSGISAKQALSSYNSLVDDFIIVHDDVYLPLGVFRIKLSGGDGGHNGVNSVIYHLGTEDFLRIRIGVGGKEFSQDRKAEYVLSDFDNDDKNALHQVFNDCSVLVDSFIHGGKKQLLDSNSKIIKPNNISDNNS